MKQITLLSTEIEGIKSFRHKQRIDFSQSAGLKLITGDNQAEPRLGANGAGKSSIWDAINWCAYGRGIPTPDYPSGPQIGELLSKGAKKASVTNTYKINDDEVIISRSGPPNKVFINGDLAEQKDVDHLLALTRSRSLHSVIFGQAVPLFLDLSIPLRGELLEEILDLELFMAAADCGTRVYNTQNQAIASIRTAMARLEGQLEGLEDFKELEQQEALFEAGRDERLEALLDRLAEAESAQRAVSRHIEEIKAELVEGVQDLYRIYHELQTQQSNLTQKRAVNDADIRRLRKDIDFYAEHDICPTCRQVITSKHAGEWLSAFERSFTELVKKEKQLDGKLADLQADAQARHKQWQEALAKRANQDAALAKLSAEVSAAEDKMTGLEDQIECIANEANPYSARKEQVERLSYELSESLKVKQEDEKQAQNKQAQYDFWRQAFKRVRLFCIKRVLLQLQLECSNAANALGLIGWRIEFATETETKSGTLKQGVQIEVFNPQGEKILRSGGEGQRLRLSVAHGFANLIQRWAGVYYLQEAWDEPSAWLSEAGIEDLLQCLQDRAEAYKKSIYVCDHRALTYSGFSEILNVVKDQDGSHIELIGRAA